MAVGQKTDLARPQRRLQLVLRLQIRVRVTLYYLQPWKPWLKDRDDSKTLCVTFRLPYFSLRFSPNPSSLSYRIIIYKRHSGTTFEFKFSREQELAKFRTNEFQRFAATVIYSLISHDFTRKKKKKKEIFRGTRPEYKNTRTFFPRNRFNPTLRDANGKRETVIDERRLLFSLG